MATAAVTSSWNMPRVAYRIFFLGGGGGGNLTEYLLYRKTVILLFCVSLVHVHVCLAVVLHNPDGSSFHTKPEVIYPTLGQLGLGVIFNSHQ